MITSFTKALIVFVIMISTVNCSNKIKKIHKKGFAVTPAETNTDKKSEVNSNDTVFITRPSSVLLTGYPQYRLATIYKLNFRKDKSTFIGSNDFYYSYSEDDEDPGKDGNVWNGHIIPGFEAVYGFNMVNISHYDTLSNKQKNLFKEHVLIKTVYYPTFERDTLNFKPVLRNYYMISVYDEDTNKDGFVNMKDLRRFYWFDIKGENKKAIIPSNYSVYKSEYDSANDFAYIFAKFDENKNGQIEETEPVNIFWVDLKNPDRTGRKY